MRSSFVSCTVALLLIGGLASVRAATVSRTLKIVNANISPDGFSRSAVLANGVFPGPLITGKMGDNFKITVNDQLTDTNMRRATSIHWHGLFQAGTNSMDGPAFVSQCPIIPNHSFTYDFSVPGQAGTYWYHSHLSTQYCDGLRGPIVIYDPNDPQGDLYDVDDENTVITLGDWYHGLTTALFPNPTQAPPIPDSTTINGLGRYVGGPNSSLAVISVNYGKRYRFRIINTSCFPAYTFSIDNHTLTVIEADGVAHDPVIIQSVQIQAGQRYSVIVNANQTVDNYWVRALPAVQTGPQGFDGGINSAILRYKGAPAADPNTTQQNPITLLNEANLHPLTNPGAPGQPFPGGADVNLNFVTARDPITLNYTMNGVAWIPPSVPILLQILSGAVAPGSILPNGSVYSLPPNKVIEISLPAGGGHPFHLHGHTFDVVRVAGSSTYNYVNPVRRDVVTIGGNPTGNVTFRFVTDNPGPWFLHCHIDWHLESGLAVVFAEDADDTSKTNSVNSQWEDLCPLYNANNPDTHLLR